MQKVQDAYWSHREQASSSSNFSSNFSTSIEGKPSMDSVLRPKQQQQQQAQARHSSKQSLATPGLAPLETISGAESTHDQARGGVRDKSLG